RCRGHGRNIASTIRHSWRRNTWPRRVMCSDPELESDTAGTASDFKIRAPGFDFDAVLSSRFAGPRIEAVVSASQSDGDMRAAMDDISGYLPCGGNSGRRSPLRLFRREPSWMAL